MNRRLTLAATALTLVLAGGPAVQASNHGSQGHGGHAGHMQGPASQDEVQVNGVLNSIDSAAGTINVTHEPVEALGWPKMTMDLPVTRRADLSTVKPGDAVRFTLKQGRDRQFRVVHIEPGS